MTSRHGYHQLDEVGDDRNLPANNSDAFLKPLEDEIPHTSNIITETKFKKRYWLIVLCSLNALIAYADRTNISVCILSIAQEFSWSSSTSGFVLSSFFYGYVCTQVMGGYLSTRFGGKRVLAWSLGLWSLFTFLTPIAVDTGMGTLTLCRIGFGLSQGVAFPSIATMLARHLPVHEQTRANALVLASTYIGAIVGNVVAAQIVAVHGWRSVFYSFGVLGAFWLLPWIWYNAPELEQEGFSRLVDAHASGGERGDVFQLVKTSEDDVLSIVADEVASQPTVTTRVEDRRVPWRKVFASKEVWALIIAQFCQSWGFWLVVTWLPTYYKDLFHVDIQNLGYFTIVPYLVQGIVAIGTGSLGDYLIYDLRWGKRLVRQVMQATSMLGMAFFMVLASTSASTIVEGMVYITLAMGIYNLSVAGMAINHMDIAPKHAGVIYGIGNTAGQVPGIIGVWMTGWLLDVTHQNWVVVFSLAAVICVVGSVVWVLWCGSEPVIDD